MQIRIDSCTRLKDGTVDVRYSLAPEGSRFAPTPSKAGVELHAASSAELRRQATRIIPIEAQVMLVVADWIDSGETKDQMSGKEVKPQAPILAEPVEAVIR